MDHRRFCQPSLTAGDPRLHFHSTTPSSLVVPEPPFYILNPNPSTPSHTNFLDTIVSPPPPPTYSRQPAGISIAQPQDQFTKTPVKANKKRAVTTGVVKPLVVAAGEAAEDQGAVGMEFHSPPFLLRIQAAEIGEQGGFSGGVWNPRN